ncbi:MAG: SAM hydrolase/SAM-dependent halogenase family protein [Mycobacteriales bacterium]
MSFVTFLSDYGLEDSYVGVCKGVIARGDPEVRVIDVCHQIAPQDIEQGAVTLASAIPYLPVGVHLALVDPVTSQTTRGVAVRTGDGSCFVAPDNGLTSLAWEAAGGVDGAWEITERSLQLASPSRLFRGRDIFAPVAGRLAGGLDPTAVGPPVAIGDLARLPVKEGYVHGDHVHADVVAVDHFGNLALDVSRSDLEAAGLTLGDTVELRAGGRTFQVPFSAHYGEVAPGRLTVCEDSYRRMTVAVNLGHAGHTVRAARGEAVVIARIPVAPPAPARRIGMLTTD